MNPDPVAAALAAMGASGPPPQTVRYPNWMDARYVLSASKWSFTTVAVGTDATARLIGADPSRFAVGFIVDLDSTGQGRVAPVAAPKNWGWSIQMNPVPQWFALFTFGPLVCAEWNGYGISACTFGVWTVSLQG